MNVFYRAQFQTPDGRTHAVVDTQPITLARLALVQVLVMREVDVPDLPPMIDLAAAPPEWLQAAEQAVQQSA